jgi:SAM-dependent methyltransferase
MVEKISVMTVARRLTRIAPFRMLRAVLRALADQFGFGLRWVGGLVRLGCFAGEFIRFCRMNRGSAFVLRWRDIQPCLTDRTATTPVEPTYFLQDAWFARKIAEQRPSGHVDVGSSARSMSLIAQFVPVTFVDIRPVEIELDGFTFLRGSVLALPFADKSLLSLSSLCVIEHIGLGRYGDPFDARGSEQAAAELNRVLAPGGHLYVSAPVDAECRIYFNAHRAFTRDYLLKLFPGLTLLEERYIYGRELVPAYAAGRGFGTGLYHLCKP